MQSRVGNVKILQPSTSIKQTEPRRCTVTPARGYFHLAKVGGRRQTRYGRDTELCFDQSFKCCSSVLSDAGLKCTVVRVKGVDAPSAAVHSAPDGSFFHRGVCADGSRLCLHVRGVFLFTKHFLCGLLSFEKQKTLLYCVRVYRKLRLFSFSLFC